MLGFVLYPAYAKLLGLIDGHDFYVDFGFDLLAILFGDLMALHLQIACSL